MLRDLRRPGRLPGLVLALWAGLSAGLAGCGGGHEKPAQELSFEQLPDTTGLTRGAPILESLEASRMTSGAVRVTGRVRLPDGTKLQIAIKQPGGRVSVAMAQVFVRSSQFDTPPLLGEKGPLPEGDYRFELLGHFDSLWQNPDVMRAMDRGVNLRGPGITRARDGSAALFLTREARL